MISKTFGPVTISETAGTVTIAAQTPVMEGVLAAVSAKAEINVSALALMDVGLLLLEEKFPALKAEIELAKAALDAELAKV